MEVKIWQDNLTVLPIYETTSLKGVLVQVGARVLVSDLSNLENKWSLKD